MWSGINSPLGILEGSISTDEFSAALLKILAVNTCGDIPKNIAVAVSGGPDSMALAALLADWGKSAGIQITAFVVNHNLRLESTVEAETVRDRLKKMGVLTHILTWNHGDKKPTTAIMERARIARYDLLQRAATALQIPYILLGHHADDQNETLIFRMLRASGLRGLAAMAGRVETPFVSWVRPLLGFSKARLIATCKARNLPFVEDPSNQNAAYTRVALRQGLLGALGEKNWTAANAALVSNKFQDLQKAVHDVAESWLKVHKTQHLLGFITVNLLVDDSPFSALPPIVKSHILRECLQDIGGQGVSGGISSKSLQNVLDWLKTSLPEGDKPKRRTLSGCVLTLTKTALKIEREPSLCALYEPSIEFGQLLENLKSGLPADIVNGQRFLPYHWDNRFPILLQSRGGGDLNSYQLAMLGSGIDAGENSHAKIRQNLSKQHPALRNVSSRTLETLPAIWKNQGSTWQVVAIPVLWLEGTNAGNLWNWLLPPPSDFPITIKILPFGTKRPFFN